MSIKKPDQNDSVGTLFFQIRLTLIVSVRTLIKKRIKSRANHHHLEVSITTALVNCKFAAFWLIEISSSIVKKGEAKDKNQGSADASDHAPEQKLHGYGQGSGAPDRRRGRGKDGFRDRGDRGGRGGDRDRRNRGQGGYRDDRNNANAPNNNNNSSGE